VLFLLTVYPLNVVRSLDTASNVTASITVSAGSNGQVSAVAPALDSAALADSIPCKLSRVVTPENVVRITPTTAAVGPVTSGDTAVCLANRLLSACHICCLQD